MPEDESGRRARDFTDRVFFNAVVILKGVVLAYGAEVLIAIMRRGAPWESVAEASVYLAWLTTMLIVTLSFVSQAFGTAKSNLHPTTLVILLSFALAITEFVAFGVLQPQLREQLPLTIRSWFLALAATTVTGSLFVSTVIHQLQSEHYPYTTGDPQHISSAKRDRLGAACTAGGATIVWAALGVPVLREDYSWIPILIVGAAILGALKSQQDKASIG